MHVPRSGMWVVFQICTFTGCSRRSFVLDPAYKGRLPQIKEQALDMALNGSGIRDTAHVLKISPTTVMNDSKKEATLSCVNYRLLALLNPDEVAVGYLVS